MDYKLYENKTTESYFTNDRNEILEFIPNTATSLLDVGCGEGGFGALLKSQRKITVWGIDLSPRAIEQAKTHLDKAIQGNFLDSADSLPNGYFDIITFNDSLEHFPDPLPALQICKEKLSPNGLIVCSLPNVRYIENVIHFLVDMDWKYEDCGILDYTHLRFFTKKSMERMFTEAGYKVISVTGIKPHYWSGKKIFLLRLFFNKYVADMKYLNYVLVASPHRF